VISRAYVRPDLGILLRLADMITDAVHRGSHSTYVLNIALWFPPCVLTVSPIVRHESGAGNFMSIHVSYVPTVHGEQKTKPTQHAVKSVRSYGLIPDIVCTCPILS
jgi:hypothetical protein